MAKDEHSWLHDKIKYNYVTSDLQKEIRNSNRKNDPGQKEFEALNRGILRWLLGFVVVCVIAAVPAVLLVNFLPETMVSSPVFALILF
ncbi:MAG: hypothetical protein K6B68_16935, partial [Eubacterium sp.]|nr:hypothetical protein [Eubacterium sp.]